MTKKTKTLLERGAKGSLAAQEKVFFANPVTSALFRMTLRFSKKHSKI